MTLQPPCWNPGWWYSISVLEMETKTRFPPFLRSAAIILPPFQSRGTQKSFSGVNERTNTDCGRCTSAQSVRIRGDFCPYLSGITPALPIRPQSRAGAWGSSQVSGCPGLAGMTAYRQALPSILRHQEMFDISLSKGQRQKHRERF